MTDPRVEMIERTVVFDGFFKLVRYRLRHGLFAGGMSPELVRELFERGHAAVVLPYDPVRDEVVLVEQFRLGALERGGRCPGCSSRSPASSSPARAPAEVARREALEEAGLELLDLVPVGSYFPSPGGSSEICIAYHRPGRQPRRRRAVRPRRPWRGRQGPCGAARDRARLARRRPAAGREHADHAAVARAAPCRPARALVARAGPDPARAGA